MSRIVKWFLASCTVLLYNVINAQNLDMLTVSKEINSLNNAKQYKASIEKIETILDDDSYTNYDHYKAYLLKSKTYKLLYNYTTAEECLRLALAVGERSNFKDEVRSRIKIEQLFIYFDLQKDTLVNKQLKSITKSDISFLDSENKAFYISLLGVLELRKENFVKSDSLLTEAINILKVNSPKDLPNIYRKQMVLFEKLNQPEKVIEAYDKGMYYANTYNIEIYKIIMLESIRDYYTKVGKYKEALDAQKKVTEARTAYDHVNQLGSLSILEKDLLNKRKNVEIQYERKIRYILIFVSAILVLLIVVMIKLFKALKFQKNILEKEGDRMRLELEQMSQSTNDVGEPIFQIEDYQLTDRQKDIIELVKKGKTNKEIGILLHISENTVKYHLKVIYTTLNINNRLDL